MRVLPRTERGTWLLAGAAWLVVCGAMCGLTPVIPGAAYPVPPYSGIVHVFPEGRGAVVARASGIMNSTFFEAPFYVCDTRAKLTSTLFSEQDRFRVYPSGASADGRWIAFHEDGLKKQILRLLDTSTGEVVNVAALDDNYGHVVFSPD